MCVAHFRAGDGHVTSFGNFPVDLVLLGMIAGFLILRLRSVLGKRTGFERNVAPAPRPGAQQSGRVITVKPEPMAEKPPGRTLPPRESPIGQTLARIQAIDSQFSPARFLDGAEGAFRLIVLAFAKGDRPALRPLLTPGMLDLFDSAITEREQANHVQHTTLHSIRAATFEDAQVTGNRASLAVRFVSDQVSYTNDATGNTVTGTEAVTEITDVWTFERDLGSRDLAWRLAASRSA
jgi:predicted lipid-binding transport protein (Tim44 family)